jgi:hypothetical protein
MEGQIRRLLDGGSLDRKTGPVQLATDWPDL